MALSHNDKKKLFGGGGRTTEDLGGAPVAKEAEIRHQVEDLEKGLNELRSTYELYFMGVERSEPTVQRDKIKATLRRLREAKPRNTALRFKIQQLRARMVSLENHWNRINREREAGTYRRDVAKAERREMEIRRKQELARAAARDEPPTAPNQPAPPDGRAITGTDLRSGKSAADTNDPARKPARPAAPADLARPRASRPEDLDDGKLQRLYNTYVGARRRCGENVNLRYEDMAASLRKQVPRLMQQTGARSVEFKVVIRNGRAIMKALPRHED